MLGLRLQFSTFVSFLILIVMDAAGAEAAPTHRCANVANPTERLACYDTEYPPTQTLNPKSTTSVAAQEKAVAEFGLSQSQVRERMPQAARERLPDRIDAQVVEVHRQSSGERIVALNNNQVWLLTEVTSKGRISSGDHISIRRASLSSYLMITPSRIPLRTRRID